MQQKNITCYPLYYYEFHFYKLLDWISKIQISMHPYFIHNLHTVSAFDFFFQKNFFLFYVKYVFIRN